MQITVSESLQKTHPGASVGVLALGGAPNTAAHPALAAARTEVETMLRQRHAGQARADLKALPVIDAYVRYYRKFKKTYHVLLQLESVAFKGQSIPDAGALVEAMFMAELDDGLLTAGHDLDAALPPLCIRTAEEDEPFTRMNGSAQPLKGDDIIMADAQSVICSILYGSDQRTRIHRRTQNVLYVTYAPPGIPTETVDAHLGHILDYVRMASPTAEELHRQIYT